MGSVEISLEIIGEIEKALVLGYNRLYINVDNLENDFGFLRVLGMQESKHVIIYEGTFPLGECYRILDLIGKSEYDIKDFTIKI